MIFLDDFVRNPRFVIHALQMACGHDFHEVFVTVVVLGQKNKVVISFLLYPVVSFRYIDFTSDDRFYRRMLGCVFEELLYTIHVAMVRYGQTWHAEFLGSVEQILNRRLSVENRILSMDVKVYE